MVQPLHIKNAHIWNGNAAVQRDLYTTDVVVDQPANGAHVVDLDGYTIFPGLINAHDHLELNHYPRSKFRDKYDNAHQWGEDMNERLDTEPYKSLRAYPLWDKLFIGGLKNLLCGATTVAHHNPPHKELWRKDFPVRVLRKYGWTHSLHFSTDAEIVESYRTTPKNVPWFIHLAEGTDDVSAGEYKRLKALGCVQENTVFIHGVNLEPADIVEAARTILGIVHCPSTNDYLLQKSYRRDIWQFNGANIAIGSDSRLTADGDFLNELRLGVESTKRSIGFGPIEIETVIEMATQTAAKILKMEQAGQLLNNAYADLILVDASEFIEANEIRDIPFALLGMDTSRASLSLVVKGGIPQIGDPDVMAKFPHIQTVAATLDGKPKRIQVDLARRILQNKLNEPGLEVDELPKQKFSIW